jgi:hypothetical protein
MQLEIKIQKLKAICSKYESNEFLTFLAGILLQIPTRDENPFLKKLMSPMRQLFFLAQLNLQKKSNEKKVGFSEKEWEEMASLLDGIEMEYFYMLGFPKQGNETKEDIEKIMVTMPTFMNYHFNGPLSYIEQEIARIKNTFKDFEELFAKDWNLTLTDFINFFELINNAINSNLRKATKFHNPEYWQAFTKKCIDKGLTDPKTWITEAPEDMRAAMDLFKNPGSFLIFDIETLDYTSLSKEKLCYIINLFTCEPRPTEEITFYTEENELFKKPIIKINETKYLPFFLKQYLNACYNLLFEKCLAANSDKLLKCRDRFLEEKTEEIFRRLFGNDAFYYVNYSIDKNNSEQDIMILYKRNAIIIEAKAAGYRAPMRDVNKAYDKIKSDFKKNIHYAFTQIERVTNAFKLNNKISITNKAKKKLYEFNPSNYKLYSIIVTLERFGVIQTNLEEMLIVNDNNYPWAVNIDDLEAFTLTLCKRKNKIQSFLSFLQHRQNYHGHLICSDELELCGLFLKNEKEFIVNSRKNAVIATSPDLTKPIETSYREGMGFNNERFLKEKRSNNSYFLYEDKI